MIFAASFFLSSLVRAVVAIAKALARALDEAAI
jgi:hypothetical protein